MHVIQRVQIVMKFWHKDKDIRKMGELCEGCRPMGYDCIVHYTCN